jgi:hypothetical protein
MKRLALLSLALSSTALAQSAAVPDLRAAKNAASRAETACSKNNQQAKCKLEVDTLLRHAQNAHAIVNPAPTPTPTPVPTPTPSPTPTPPPVSGYVPSPSLAGAAPLVASFPVSEGLQPSWGTGDIPGPYSPDEGAFRFTCGGEGELNYDDPLVYPGQKGAAHLHKYFGAVGVNYATTMASLANVTASTCNYGSRVLNRSAYWMPALLDDQGSVRNPDWIAVYYKRARSTSGACDPANDRRKGICISLPNQIEFLGGWDQFKPAEPGKGNSWYCSGGTGGHFPDLDAVFQSGCKAGDQLIADIVFPDCWDGRYLDTPDHRSHVAYAGYGSWGYLKCPSTHPYVIPQTTNKYSFTVTADMIGTRADGTKFSRVRLSSDHMKANAKPGETLHGDYMEQWVGEAKRMWHDHCIEKGLDCSGGDLGNGLQLAGASQPAYGWGNPNPRSPVPARPQP